MVEQDLLVGVPEPRPPVGSHSGHGVTLPTAHGCPFCSGKRPSVTNRLDILHPDLALEWDEDANGGSPTVVAGSEKKAWWKCQHGHTWDAIIRNRTVLGSGCPKCAGVAMSKRRS